MTREHFCGKGNFKDIISGLYFTAFANILPKLRYFEGINYIQIS